MKKQLTIPVAKNGKTFPGGSVYTYRAGTTTNKETYTGAAGAIVNSNPVVLDTDGDAGIFLNQDEAYKITLKDADGNEVFTADNVVENGEFAVEAGSVAMASDTTFTVTGDKTGVYEYPAEVVLLQPSGGTGTVLSSSFDGETGKTTVTLTSGSSTVHVDLAGVMVKRTATAAIKAIKAALSGDMVLSCSPATAGTSAATLNAAAAGTVTQTITVSLKDAAGNLHKWSSAAIAAAGSVSAADADIGAPSVSNATPSLSDGTVDVTLTYDTDAGVTKTYASGDTVTLTVNGTILGYALADATFVDTIV